MKKKDIIPKLFVAIYLFFLLGMTFYEKMAFISGKPYLNLLLLVPVATFYGVFSVLYRSFDDPKAVRILWIGLNIGLLLFVILLILVYLVMK